MDVFAQLYDDLKLHEKSVSFSLTLTLSLKGRGNYPFSL